MKRLQPLASSCSCQIPSTPLSPSFPAPSRLVLLACALLACRHLRALLFDHTKPPPLTQPLRAHPPKLDRLSTRAHRRSLREPDTCDSSSSDSLCSPTACARSKQQAEEGWTSEVRRREVLNSTGCRRRIPTPLHQPPCHCLSDGLIGSDGRWKAVEQLELLVRRVAVEQRDDEDRRPTRPPATLREHQRSSCTLCRKAAGNASHQLGKAASRVAAAGNHPRTARRATQDEPPRRRWRVEEARARTPPTPPSAPSLLRCGGGAAERRYCRA